MSSAFGGAARSCSTFQEQGCVGWAKRCLALKRAMQKQERAHHSLGSMVRGGGHASAFTGRASAQDALCPPYGIVRSRSRDMKCPSCATITLPKIEEGAG